MEAMYSVSATYMNEWKCIRHKQETSGLECYMEEKRNHIREYLFPTTKDNEIIILLEQVPLKLGFITNHIINKEQFSCKLSNYK